MGGDDTFLTRGMRICQLLSFYWEVWGVTPIVENFGENFEINSTPGDSIRDLLNQRWSLRLNLWTRVTYCTYWILGLQVPRLDTPIYTPFLPYSFFSIVNDCIGKGNSWWHTSDFTWTMSVAVGRVRFGRYEGFHSAFWGSFWGEKFQGSKSLNRLSLVGDRAALLYLCSENPTCKSMRGVIEQYFQSWVAIMEWWFHVNKLLFFFQNKFFHRFCGR